MAAACGFAGQMDLRTFLDIVSGSFHPAVRRQGPIHIGGNGCANRRLGVRRDGRLDRGNAGLCARFNIARKTGRIVTDNAYSEYGRSPVPNDWRCFGAERMGHVIKSPNRFNNIIHIDKSDYSNPCFALALQRPTAYFLLVTQN